MTQIECMKWSAFEAAGVPCGPINDLAGVSQDPQVGSLWPAL